MHQHDKLSMSNSRYLVLTRAGRSLHFGRDLYDTRNTLNVSVIRLEVHIEYCVLLDFVTHCSVAKYIRIPLEEMAKLELESRSAQVRHASVIYRFPNCAS